MQVLREGQGRSLWLLQMSQLWAQIRSSLLWTICLTPLTAISDTGLQSC